MIISKLEKHFGLGKEDAEEYFDKYAKQRTDFSFTNPITGTMKKNITQSNTQIKYVSKESQKRNHANRYNQDYVPDVWSGAETYNDFER